MSNDYYEDELTRISTLFTDLLAITGHTTPVVPGEPGSTITDPT